MSADVSHSQALSPSPSSSPHGTWEPRPAARWEDAFLSGNGRHGAMVFGDPNDGRVIVTHHTLVRPNGGEHARPPELAAQLPRLQDRLLAGDLTAAEEFTDGRPLQWVQPFHPAFQVRLRRPADRGRGYRRSIDFTTGVAEAACTGWSSRVFVSRADDVIVQHVTSPGLTADIALDHRLPGSELLKRLKSPALLERLFAAGRYHLLSAAGMLPPRLTGLWTGDWDTAWSGAFTTDANLNLQTASAVAGALPEVVEAHAALIHGQLPHWRDNARAVFGTRGIVAPPHTDGESGHTYHFSREYPLHLWTAGADWLLKPLVDHDEARGEHGPRLKAALAELALFYEDFLTRTDEHGRLVVVPSYSPENRPANASWGAINAAMDLSAARHVLLTAAVCHLGPDADRRRALAARLPPHRVNDDGALAEWAWPGLDDTYDHRHLSHLYGVWPLDEINPYDTPDLAAAAHRALELRGAENDSAHGHLHHALVAARLRDGERVAHALGQVLEGDFFHTSLISALPRPRRLQRGRRPHPPRRDHRDADPVDPGQAGPAARPARRVPGGRTPGRTDEVRRRGRPRLESAGSPRGGSADPDASRRPQDFLRSATAPPASRRRLRPQPGAAVEPQ
ncbi:hypothetical protein QF035_003319 [Streptomyces umbrinus]|uniref:Glycosyl hydrolase family 95 N-terminal domain-containing protein n=1 Tax=Streptomyces umbrinus TaxID=67370 RepID=A0ABU0SQH9_9ACTN|nr:hypothetical protein [Streptomyces umbrinus]